MFLLRLNPEMLPELGRANTPGVTAMDASPSAVRRGGLVGLPARGGRHDVKPQDHQQNQEPSLIIVRERNSGEKMQSSDYVL